MTASMIRMQVEGLGVLSSDVMPMLLLREEVGARRWLAIAVGLTEAEALVHAHQRIDQDRPGTIELIGKVLGAFGHRVDRVEFTHLREDMFFAELILDDGNRVPARPSDAVALALRADAPVEAAEGVLDEASIDVDLTDLGHDGPAADTDKDIVRFRRLLDTMNADDFRDERPFS